MDNEKNKKIGKALYVIATALATAIAILFGLQSCQVSRTVTTSAESYQRGDTAMVIQTKTIETYTGTKK
jgi:hypothetical protein